MTETLLFLVGITFISMMSPGPDMMLLIKNSVTGCRKSALACVAGICTSITIHVALATFGLAAIISTSVMLYNLLRYAGAAYLIYVGWKSIRHAQKSTLLSRTNNEPTRVVDAYRDGLLCNILNPKFTIYLVSIFSQFIGPETALFERIVYGSAIILEGVVVWSLFVFVIQARVVQTALERFQVAINRVAGGFLLAFGVFVAVED